MGQEGWLNLTLAHPALGDFLSCQRQREAKVRWPSSSLHNSRRPSGLVCKAGVEVVGVVGAFPAPALPCLRSPPVHLSPSRLVQRQELPCGEDATPGSALSVRREAGHRPGRAVHQVLLLSLGNTPSSQPSHHLKKLFSLSLFLIVFVKVVFEQSRRRGSSPGARAEVEAAVAVAAQNTVWSRIWAH